MRVWCFAPVVVKNCQRVRISVLIVVYEVDWGLRRVWVVRGMRLARLLRGWGEKLEKAFERVGTEIERAFEGVGEEVEEAAAGEELVVCPECREENIADAKFCYKCGKRLE